VSAVDRPSQTYRLRIRGHLDPTWSTWLDDLTITQEDDGTTTLAGPLVDQAALYGLLGRLRDLGATLLGVEHLAADGPAAGAAIHELKSLDRRRMS
jgi:hypothetical protein